MAHNIGVLLLDPRQLHDRATLCPAAAVESGDAESGRRCAVESSVPLLLGRPLAVIELEMTLSAIFDCSEAIFSGPFSALLFS